MHNLNTGNLQNKKKFLNFKFPNPINCILNSFAYYYSLKIVSRTKKMVSILEGIIFFYKESIVR